MIRQVLEADDAVRVFVRIQRVVIERRLGDFVQAGVELDERGVRRRAPRSGRKPGYVRVPMFVCEEVAGDVAAARAHVHGTDLLRRRVELIENVVEVAKRVDPAADACHGNERLTGGCQMLPGRGTGPHAPEMAAPGRQAAPVAVLAGFVHRGEVQEPIAPLHNPRVNLGLPLARSVHTRSLELPDHVTPVGERGCFRGVLEQVRGRRRDAVGRQAEPDVPGRIAADGSPDRVAAGNRGQREHLHDRRVRRIRARRDESGADQILIGSQRLVCREETATIPAAGGHDHGGHDGGRERTPW